MHPLIRRLDSGGNYGENLVNLQCVSFCKPYMILTTFDSLQAAGTGSAYGFASGLQSWMDESGKNVRTLHHGPR